MGSLEGERRQPGQKIKAGCIAAQQAILSQLGYNFCKLTLLDPWDEKEAACRIFCAVPHRRAYRAAIREIVGENNKIG